MFLYPLRWLLRQVLGGILTSMLVAVGLLWALQWVPLPPVGVVLGYFSAQAPQWGWLGESEHLTWLRSALRRIEAQTKLRHRPSLSQRAAEQLFYPPDAPKWGSALLGGLLELLWREDRLLTFYLNSIPYDKDVYGIKAAAQRHFHKDVERLTPDEMAELLLRREGPPLSKPLSSPLLRERQRLARILSMTAHGS